MSIPLILDANFNDAPENSSRGTLFADLESERPVRGIPVPLPRPGPRVGPRAGRRTSAVVLQCHPQCTDASRFGNLVVACFQVGLDAPGLVERNLDAGLVAQLLPFIEA